MGRFGGVKMSIRSMMRPGPWGDRLIVSNRVNLFAGSALLVLMLVLRLRPIESWTGVIVWAAVFLAVGVFYAYFLVTGLTRFLKLWRGK